MQLYNEIHGENLGRKISNLANGHEIVVGFPIADPDVRRLVSKLLQQSQFLPFPDQNPRLLHEPRRLPRLRIHLNLSSDHLISAQIVFHERFHHDRRIRCDYHFSLALVEDGEALRPHIARVEPRQHGSRRQLDVAHLQPGERDVDQHLDGEGFGDEDVGYGDERERQEEDQPAEEAAGLDRYQHEVREGGAGDQEGSVEVSRDRVAVRAGEVAFLDRREARRGRRGGFSHFSVCVSVCVCGWGFYVCMYINERVCVGVDCWGGKLRFKCR